MQKAKSDVLAVNDGLTRVAIPDLYPLPTYTHPSLTDMPPYTVAPVS